jgi:serine/threonine protein kinase
MDISEVQRHFTAYGSGELAEGELRNSIREALSEDPELSPAFVALADAYRRANLIDADLQSAIIADITEVTGPKLGLTMVRTGRPTPAISSWPTASRGRDPFMTQPTARSLAERNGARTPSLPAGFTGDSGWSTGGHVGDVATALFPGSILRDRFELVQELGRGGMGVVYKAFDRSRADMRDRYVAIKVLSEDFKRHPLAVRALQREARKAQKLAHPNVVTVHDCDRDGGNVYMVMELLSGRSLDQVIRGDGKGGIPIQRALEIVACLGAALSYAHEQDIVHSDFKPSNAFLTDDGKVKVLDFGIARAAPSRAERGEKTMFDAGQLGAISPPYASLEMIKGSEPDIRDDVYALACVAYELLTGYHPFQRIDAVKAHETGLQPRAVRGLSRSQWRALKQGLAFLRADRTPTIDAFVSQLVATRSIRKVWIAGAGAAVVATAAAVTLVSQWHAPRVAVPQRDIGDNDPARVSATLAAQPKPPVPPVSADSNKPSTVAADESRLAPAGTVGLRPAATATPSPSATATFSPAPAATQQAMPDAGRPSTGETSEMVAASVAAARDRMAKGGIAPAEQQRVGVELTKEKLETQAAAGDVAGASTTAASLGRSLNGSAYAVRDLPQMLITSYLNRAKAQFAAGQVDDSLATLAEGRRKFSKSQDLHDLQLRYVTAAEFYDRLSTAVALNVPDRKRALEELRTSEGDEFSIAEKMLAQTLANRIADQRAANRDAVADKLTETGKEIFPDYSALLSQGTAGVLSGTPPMISDQ